MQIYDGNNQSSKVDLLVIEDREETIEEDIEDSHETNNQQRGRQSPHTPDDVKGTSIPVMIDGADVSPYQDEPIGYSASLKKKDAELLQESVLPLLAQDEQKD